MTATDLLQFVCYEIDSFTLFDICKRILYILFTLDFIRKQLHCI